MPQRGLPVFAPWSWPAKPLLEGPYARVPLVYIDLDTALLANNAATGTPNAPAPLAILAFFGRKGWSIASSDRQRCQARERRNKHATESGLMQMSPSFVSWAAAHRYRSAKAQRNPALHVPAQYESRRAPHILVWLYAV